jgi:hypothetical protein
MEDRHGHGLSAEAAQKVAHMIAFAPEVFQVTRIMLERGIFASMDEAFHGNGKGLTLSEVADKSGLSEYACKVLLESSLNIGTVSVKDGFYSLTKIGWFLLNDPMIRPDIEFNHDINYKGMFHLEEAMETGKPAGLKELGPWPTIYEGLSSLSEKEKKSWFGFDHFYSDVSFDEVLPVVFSSKPGTLLDIGGNTGRFALRCVGYDDDVKVTIMDLPQQIGLMEANVKGKPGSERISGHAGDLLDPETVIPGGFDVVWMSQFLDCFSSEQAGSILSRVASTLEDGASVFILETLWDRQKYSTAAFDIAQTSVYFTAMANGNSKMFNSGDLFSIIKDSGLEIADIKDGIGEGHSLIRCVRK